MKNSITAISAIAWVCVIAGGFLLVSSLGGTDRTASAAIFYAVAVLAFTAKAGLLTAQALLLQQRGTQ